MSDDPYNAFITRVEPAGKTRPGPLSGRTLAVKDLFDTAGVRTTYGSRIYADHVPDRNAVAVQRLFRFSPVLGMSDETFAKVMTAQMRLMRTTKRP